ncbi:MAG: CPBP family intramembrane metalloprotease [Oscillospiraceae bacterium]|nr:CPBP family intramembrane metalloprotease [Oscillospiraceae bacterium]
MDTNYSISRRIWRIIYPVLIFIGVQFAVMIVVGIFVSVFISMDAIKSAGGFDMEAILDDSMRFLTERTVLILLISNVASLGAFVPIWLKTRTYCPQYINSRPGKVCLLVVGLLAAMNIVQMIIFSLVDVTKYFPSYNEVAEMLTTDSFALQFLTVGIAAPITEELVFRGILISRMRWMPAWAAVLVQGLLFGLVHMNLFQGLYAFVAGVVLGIIFVRYRSILITIAGHVAFNISSLLLSEFAGEEAIAIILCAAVALLPICIVFIAKSKKAEVWQPQNIDNWRQV